jgi:tRNA(Arg) A34 adenosine deaminase TadA
MCLGAIYWARLERIYYANDRGVAAEAGFDDAFIYNEIARPIGRRVLPTRHLTVDGADEAFRVWEDLEDRIEY